MTETKSAPATGEFNLLGDMSVLREIIMGPQIISNTLRFSEMHAEIERHRVEIDARLAALEKSVESRLQNLETALQQQITSLRESTEKARLRDRDNLSESFVAFGNSIKLVK